MLSITSCVCNIILSIAIEFLFPQVLVRFSDFPGAVSSFIVHNLPAAVANVSFPK